MIAYLRIILLRWLRNSIALQALIGALGAPLAFSAAAFWEFFNLSPGTSEHTLMQFHKTVTISSVLFSTLVAAIALTHLLTRTLHIEKQKCRIRLLRASGFDAVLAMVSYLTAGALGGTLLALLATVGGATLGFVTEIPRIGISLLISNIAAVNLLCPFIIASRLILPQAFALTVSYSVAFLVALVHTSQTAAQSFSPPPIYVILLVFGWALASGLLLLVAFRDDRGMNRLWA